MSGKLDKNNYTVTELIHNPSFCRMVQGTASAEEVDRWSHWIEASGQNRSKAKEAISEIAGFSFDIPDQPNVKQEWGSLYKDTIGKRSSISGNAKPDTQRGASGASLKWIYRIAAIFILGIIVGVGSYMYSGNDQATTRVEQITQERTIRTGAGEEKTVKFSNGSKVILNSNSAITYSVGLLHSQMIKVVLEGEAYFDAKSDTAQAQPIFAVHTPDGVIRDIGTEFLVAVKEDRSNVVLQEGKVEVNIKDQANRDKRITVQQGELLEFDKSTVLSKKMVNATFFTSWATGFMEFSQTTIKEFADFVERRFDVEVQVANSELASITLDGAVYFESLSGLVRSVSDVTKIPVYQSEDRKTVYIGDTNRE